MVSADSEDPARTRYVDDSVQQSMKILVVGAFGVGKTTLIGSVSEIPPLHTEETMTAESVGIDDLAGMEGKTTTTVALDFGRLTVSTRTILYLFGAPGQPRFWDFLEELAEGAIGVLVLVDTRRLERSFDVLDHLEGRPSLPLAVAVNHFPDTQQHDTGEIREALDLLPETPVVTVDARDRRSSAQALITLVEHAIDLSKASPWRTTSELPTASPS